MHQQATLELHKANSRQKCAQAKKARESKMTRERTRDEDIFTLVKDMEVMKILPGPVKVAMKHPWKQQARGNRPQAARGKQINRAGRQEGERVIYIYREREIKARATRQAHAHTAL
jgi:hypothetical protein